MEKTNTLAEQLAATAAAGRAKRDPEKQRVFDQSNQKIAEMVAGNKALKKGDKAPNFSLPNHKGEPTAIDTLLKDGPVVVSFYRGAWCPYCNLELRALQEKLPEIKANGANLVAVSPQTPDGSMTAKEQNALTFNVLSDHDNKVAREFGLVFTLPAELVDVYRSMGLDLGEKNGTGKFELPVPATYVIDRDRTIRHAHVDVDYTKRQEPSEIINIVAGLKA